mmetsp:Transcript_2178/g.6581  ORF Transcript_2178/g.6581 Transcript_2178/m.6581 type:complete len:249 (-) Transcript_2178:63-809(-)
MAVDWVNDTGYKRSTHDTESERKAFRPQKASADSTGFTSQIASLMADGIMEKAMADKMAAVDQGQTLAEPRASEEEEGEQPAQRDEEDRGAGGDAEDELEALRARRRQQMKDAQAKRQKWQQLGHGEYAEIPEEDFLKTVTASERSIVHFYHRHFERCKIVDMHLGKCARKFFGTRFVKLDSEKAPFFVEKLKIKTLPCVVVFIDGVAKGRQVGFEGLGADDFSTPQLAGRLKEFGGIEEDFDPDDEF